MTEQIKELTKEQEDLIDVYKDKWIDIGLSTTRANIKEAEKWAKKSYEAAGKKAPKDIYRAKSPVGGVYISFALKNKLANTKKIIEFVNTGKPFRDGMDIRAQLGIEAEMSSIMAEVDDQIYGSQDASWLSFYNYFLEVCGLKDCEPLIPLMNLAKDCGWWAPYDTCMILQEKPTMISLINDNLHKEDGPAIEYGDGFSVYALNDVIVPDWVVTTKAEDIDSKRILESKYDRFDNTHEIRSEIIKKIGAKRVVKDLNFKLEESLSGEELYSKHPIGDYYQQGDVIFLPLGKNKKPILQRYMVNGEEIDDEMKLRLEIRALKDNTNKGEPSVKQVAGGFADLDPKTKIRLRQGVFYELYSADLDGIKFKALRMGNPSVDGEEHIEWLDDNCESIFEAIIFRNFGESHNYKELIAEGKGFLPCKIS